MIQSKKDLKFYLKEDGKRNGFDKGYMHYAIHLLIGSENARSYRYLRALRRCEYQSQKKSPFCRLVCAWYKLKLAVLGSRYHIQIPLNKSGYGLRIMHLSGGGGCC